MVEVDEKQVTQDIQAMVDLLVEIDKLHQQLALRLSTIIGATTK